VCLTKHYYMRHSPVQSSLLTTSLYVFIVRLIKLLIKHALASSGWMPANNEFEIMLNEMIVALFKVLFLCLE
jgi:hypothetical protein